MWTFKGYYTGEAKECILKIKKKEARTWAWIGSVVIVFTCIILALVFNIEDTIIDTIFMICGSLLGIVIINLVLFLEYKRSPKNDIQILNDGIQFIESGSTRSVPFYKIAPIEYHDDFIVICNKLVLQKELLEQGDWEELKLLFKRVEESLETDNPMYQIEEPETQFFDAIVKSKRIYEQFVGGVSVTTPVGLFRYFTTFLLENGEEIECEISQEWYEKIVEDQSGVLVIISGNFFSFGEGENIE